MVADWNPPLLEEMADWKKSGGLTKVANVDSGEIGHCPRLVQGQVAFGRCFAGSQVKQDILLSQHTVLKSPVVHQISF